LRKNLTLNGRDLDQELSRFESSQHFNLVDVGAFFFAGPVQKLFNMGRDLFPGGEREVFYTGSVAPPK